MASGLFKDVANLKGQNGETVPVTSLDGPGKVLGLYFSAHWCPPCRGFTPKLAEWYTKVTSEKLKGKLEIVFVSSDRDEIAFDEYFETMPWLALPFEERDLKATLSKKYKVQGIPTLVFVNAETGMLNTKDGRAVISEDPSGDKFPWAAEPFSDIIEGEFVNKSGEKITWSDCQDKIVGLYFSAHWCPPCQKFTPELATFYNKMKGKNFEVIFVSSDNSEEEFTEYLESMPWYAVPYIDARREKLDKCFEIQGIPTLVILEGSTGKVITDSGRGMVPMDPEGKDFPWYPQPVELLHTGKIDDVNERTCFIWFTDGTDEQIKQAKTALEPTAKPYFEANRDKDDSICFMYTKCDGLAERLQGYVKISPPFPVLAVIDMPNQRKCICTEDKLNEESVKRFFENFNSGKAEWKDITD